jgi:hypothetical protein
MKNRPYYIILGSHEFVTRPFDRVIGLEAAKQAIEKERKNGVECFYITSSEYRELTGRCASTDYLQEINS